jgi:hypothetical protein
MGIRTPVNDEKRRYVRNISRWHRRWNARNRIFADHGGDHIQPSRQSGLIAVFQQAQTYSKMIKLSPGFLAVP